MGTILPTRKFLAGASLAGLLAAQGSAWAAITADPEISSSSHQENVSSTNSDISASWTAATSNSGGSITYEYLFDTTASHNVSSFQAAVDSNTSNASVPFDGQLIDVTSRDFDDVPDGTYYLHVRAYDSAGPIQGSAIVTYGPMTLNSAPTLDASPISPASGSHVNAVTVTISGNRFMDGATVDLVGPSGSSSSTTVALTSVQFVNSTELTATVPADTAPGDYDITVTNPAPFNQSITVSDAYTSTNNAPTAAAGDDQTVTLPSNSSVTINLDGSSSSDTDEDTIGSYTWTVLSAPAESDLSTNQVLAEDSESATTSVSVTEAGDYQFGLVVNDGFVDSAQDSLTVTVQAEQGQNNPPVADAGEDQTVFVDDTVTLDASGTIDPDTDSVTYSWAFSSTPSGSSAAFNDSTSETPSFTADVAGTYVIELTASDNDASHSDSVVVTVADSVTLNYSFVKNDGNTSVNALGFVLADTGYTMASELYAAISNIDGLSRWDATTQQYVSYIDGLSFTDFALQLGDAYFISVTAATNFSLSGSPSDISFTLNKNSGTTSVTAIGLPQGSAADGIGMASDLYSAVTNTDGLSRWNASTQQYESYIDGLSFTDFSVTDGGAYFISVGVGSTWNP